MNITINGKRLEVAEGKTILEAARENGIVIPTLCYLKGLNEVGACRICVVEAKGADRLVASCSTKVSEGMEIETNSARVVEARRQNLRLILSAHDCNCLTCERNGRCRLQLLAQNMGLMERQPYPTKVPKDAWDRSLPLIRRDSRCISCLRCVSVCDRSQGLKVWDLLGLGTRAKVGVREGKPLVEAGCTFCGQCVTHCPVGALGEREDARLFLEAVNDSRKTVVVQLAPAACAAWADEFGLASGRVTGRRMAAAFRRLGAKFVFDANYAADLVAREEAGRLLERLKARQGADEGERPIFASHCPAWVRFLKQTYPDLAAQLSYAKSPSLLLGGLAKSHLAKSLGKDRADLVCVSVTPCLAEKWERETADDVDLVLTTREAAHLMKLRGIELAHLPESDFDSPFVTGGVAAGLGFGESGGLADAVLRTALFLSEGESPAPGAFRAVRNVNGRGELTVALGGTAVRACVVSGLAQARQVVEDVRSGRAQYDFVEVMACPGGCAGGERQLDSSQLASSVVQ